MSTDSKTISHPAFVAARLYYNTGTLPFLPLHFPHNPSGPKKAARRAKKKCPTHMTIDSSHVLQNGGMGEGDVSRIVIG